MFTVAKRIWILVCVLSFTSPLYAQNVVGYSQEADPNLKAEPPLESHVIEVPAPVVLKEKTVNYFLDFVNKNAYAATIDEGKERGILREKWKELLRIDIFYTYFKAKEVEEWVSQKASVNFFNIKGQPKLENSQIKYIFKVKF